MAVLAGLILLVPRDSNCHGFGAIAISAAADNQGDSYLLDKLATATFPLGLMLMESVAQLKSRNMDFRLRWIRRDRNVEADALTDEEFGGFDESRRIRIELKELDFNLLDRLLAGEPGVLR